MNTQLHNTIVEETPIPSSSFSVFAAHVTRVGIVDKIIHCLAKRPGNFNAKQKTPVIIGPIIKRLTMDIKNTSQLHDIKF